ncbi:DegQ family serine endoprotease [Paracoccus sp. (in: a-proteobacteria)]|uniref:DegQ family serine endoprotease n=1 Tax=Paracoccus sp. TaxID=267 RepID=UPI0026E1110C|nr:DegQ family serine endoprotease [Paracoccus sp. (in: a-proteobacteria)]MDO5370916.1 DegQ family serine endoprotease [Paracoccus sp. (in: a-proteobacteria)]
MPQSFADIVEQVSPAVVNITTTAIVSRPVNQFPGLPPGSPFSDLFRDFGIPGPGGPGSPFGDGPQMQQRSNALGSGFVVSSDGLIVTNNHVIDGADEIEIEFYSGARLPATLVGTDPTTDIAVLKVEAENPLPFVSFGDSDAARVGDWVLALGNPLGQGFSATTGIVSAKSRALTGTYDDFIQTDAAINRGNSGGPLFNLQGEVIGVNTAILSPSGGSIGIGFSMASNVVKGVVDQLQEYGETRRGWLGVKIQDVSPDIAESLGLASEAGAMVTDVPPGPAADAGIQAGDVITAFAGGEVEDTRDLVRRVAAAPVGEAVDVTVMRDGEPVTLQITLGRRELADADGTGQRPDGGGPQGTTSQVLGMTLAPMTPELAARMQMPEGTSGLVVQDIDAASDASAKGLRTGDLIVEAGQQPVASVADLNARITEAREAGRQSVLVLIRREGEPRFVALSIEE